MALVSSAIGCEPAPPDPEASPWGRGQLPFASPANEVNVSDSFSGTQRHAFDPSAAWIRTPNDASGDPTAGHALVGYTRREQLASGATIDAAAWAVSTGWTAATPTYTERRANEWLSGSGSHRWPAPDNLCGYYTNATECGGSTFTWNSATANHWQRVAAALWTGLDRGAAIVTTGGGVVAGEDVFVVASNDGGQSFQRSLIVSIEEGGPATLTGEGTPAQSGGGIVPGSVQASLAWHAERTSPVAGRLSIPIDVVWQNDLEGEDPEWWWARVTVGEDAQIAIVTHPQRLPATVPRQPGVRVSIFGYRVDDQERVGIAWSERGDASAPNDCTSSTSTTSITWYAAETRDLGGSWGCFEGNAPGSFSGCSGGETTIASAESWPTCIKVHATSPIVNNDRPEVAMNAPAKNDGDGVEQDMALQYFYFAVTKNQGSRPAACVYRTGGLDIPPPVSGEDFDNIAELTGACTPSTDASGRVVTSSSAQAIAVAQATSAEPRVQLVYRNRLKEEGKLRYDVLDIEWDALPSGTVTQKHHLSTVDMDFDVGTWGRYSSVVPYERCDAANAACPQDTNFGLADAQTWFLAAFTDSRRGISPKVTDAWTRKFSWE